MELVMTLPPWGRMLLPGLLVRLEAAGAACSRPFPLVWLARELQGQGMAGARALSLHITRMKSQRTRGTLWAIAGAVSLGRVELSGLRGRKMPKFCDCFPLPTTFWERALWLFFLSRVVFGSSQVAGFQTGYKPNF